MNHDRDLMSRTWSLSQFHEINAICGEFELAWKKGTPVPVEHFLDRYTTLPRTDLLVQLLGLELRLRRDAGETPNFEQYQERFAAEESIVASVWSNAKADAEPDRIPSTKGITTDSNSQ